jgi:HlyD family secretion protein
VKFRTWIQLLIFAGVVTALLFYAFMPRPVSVDLEEIQHGPLIVTVSEDGKTRIKEKYVVSSPLAGRLMRIQLKSGDEVVEGKTLLAVIEPTDPALLDPRAKAEAEARLKAAEATLERTEPILEKSLAEVENAEEELTRGRKLMPKNAITVEELNQRILLHRTRTQEYRAATFDREIARFELEQAKAALLRTQPDDNGKDQVYFEIRSPISGRVLNVLQESATVVASGIDLIEVGNPKDLEVEVDVLSSDAVQIRSGARAWLDQWGGKDPLPAAVRLVEPSGFTKISALGVEEQRVNVIIDFTSPPAERETLGSGFRVEANIVTWEDTHVLRVPISALFRHEQGWAVFRVVNEQAAVTPIKIGHRNASHAEVLEGLTERDRVVVHPSDDVADGVSIVAR